MELSTKLCLYRRRGGSLGHRYRRDGVLEDELILVVGFEHYRVLVKAANLSDKANTAYQKNRYGNLIASHGVEINVLNVLGRRSFVLHFRLHKIHQGKGLLYGGPPLLLLCCLQAHQTTLSVPVFGTRSTDVSHTCACLVESYGLYRPTHSSC